MHTAILEAIDAYLEHLNNGGKPVSLRKPKHRHVEGTVPPSALGLCPLKSALRHAAPTYPELAPDLNTRWRMRHGTVIAEQIQQAMVFKYGKQRVKTEKLLSRRGLRGYADIVFDDAVLEVKNVRENYPKLQAYQILQVMAYGYILDSPLMFIVTVNRNEVKTYRLQGDWDTGFQAVDDATGSPADTPFISRMEFIEELNRHRVYMLGKTDDPIPDYLNHPYSWLCVDKLKKPKDGKAGTYRASCENYCHHQTEVGQEHEYNVTDGKFVSLESVF